MVGRPAWGHILGEKKVSTRSHVLEKIAARPFKRFIDVIRNSPDISHMITRIVSQRLECVQKEHYEKLYKEGGQIKYNEGYSMEVHQSIVNDIDDFYNRIKMNKINFTDRRLFTNYMYKSFNDFFGLWDAQHSVKTFHLSMLTDEDERKIHSENTQLYTGNRNLDYFKNKTTLSRNEPNYALSLCMRKTLHMRSFENGEVYIRNIIEPDPWAERIKSNYEELQRLKKRKAQEPLEYYKTHWEIDTISGLSDSSDSN